MAQRSTAWSTKGTPNLKTSWMRLRQTTPASSGIHRLSSFGLIMERPLRGILLRITS
ncbi:hypothetical protein CIHG_10206 [Coccidioides immitis H538.4]|uniref:Uncharacterized protein n=1 Tax=Coccidioides immitis H538.4 TaxID=396776 RepID=A0A0J8S4V3_COCIT|nr:hypothetical protein CIHG_10206 [Coccidioides immitis H538.4]